jgi:hypothetical protein
VNGASDENGQTDQLSLTHTHASVLSLPRAPQLSRRIQAFYAIKPRVRGHDKKNCVTETSDGQSVFLSLLSTFRLLFRRRRIKVRPDYSCSHLCFTINAYCFIHLNNGAHRSSGFEWLSTQAVLQRQPGHATTHSEYFERLSQQSLQIRQQKLPAPRAQAQVAWTHLYNTTCTFTSALPNNSHDGVMLICITVTIYTMHFKIGYGHFALHY